MVITVQIIASVRGHCTLKRITCTVANFAHNHIMGRAAGGGQATGTLCPSARRRERRKLFSI